MSLDMKADGSAEGNDGCLLHTYAVHGDDRGMIERRGVECRCQVGGVVLDVGATIGADAQQLVDFAILGTAMAHALFQLDRPKVGLLNVGVEEIKGQEEVREAGRLLREAGLASMDYRGFVEGDGIGRGEVDVVVTEGFSGNIALKTAEGTARQIAEYLRAAMSQTLMARAGYILAKGAFDRLREKMDVRKINGGIFLGLNGIVVKSHGGTDDEGFAAAVELGYEMVRSRLLDSIGRDLALYHGRRAKGESAAGDGPVDHGEQG
jgi:glycerol-3-phosphate acyltransferase PlsX